MKHKNNPDFNHRLTETIKPQFKKIKKIKFGPLLLKIGAAGLALMVLMFIWFSKDLPTPARIAKKINIPSTQILDREGNLLYAVSGDKKRLVIPFTDMPDNIKHATIALEDRNFYSHHGVDVRGIARSVLKNATSDSRVGGSTITQQFIKNALLSPKKTISRKIKELILAFEIEIIYPKDKILELYLNEIPYGSTAYGIEAASKTYFKKSAKDLTLAESATLAAMPQAPSYYSPYGPNKDALLKRKNYALDQMVKEKYITEAEAEEAKKQEISFQPRKDSIMSPHFVFYVQELIANKYGEEALQNGGLKVYTSLDPKAQKMAEEAVEQESKRLDRYGANNAALVAVDPKTGQVMAMVGSRDYFNSDIQGQVNVTTSKRQPGSSFKPIVYATGFKGKYNPAYPLFDLKTDFGGGYNPDNYNGQTYGPVSIRTALSNSLNIPAVKMLSLVGLNNAVSTAFDLGIESLEKNSTRYGLSLVLGAGEVKPIEMAGAFGVFANDGQRNPVTPIIKVEDHDGKILEEFKESPNSQVIDSQVAYLISDVLSDSEARRMIFGFTNSLNIPGHRVAVKTGTTQSNRDAWTVGYTPQISTAVWVGNTDNKEMKSGADGSIVAAPLWNSFMRKYLAKLPNEDFNRPEGIKQVSVDFLSNKLPSDHSPEPDRRTDIFASWNAPKERDDIHVSVKINKSNGKLATDQTPQELIEDLFCAKIQSERPDSPSWENPVRSWAASKNLNCDPPKDQDDAYNDLSKRPVVEIVSPAPGESVSGQFSIVANASATHGVKEVSFAIDGRNISATSNSPYTASTNTAEFGAGSHTIVATVTDGNGVRSDSQPISIVVPDTTQPTPASTETPSTGGTSVDVIPPSITGVSANSSSTTVTINWNTNEAADGQIEYGTSLTLGQLSIKDSTFSASHSISIGGLTKDTRYYYRIISKDSTGNQAVTGIESFQTKK